MAIKKVDDASLTAVADAIREKGGTESLLEFPDGFISAIEDIKGSTGGVYIDEDGYLVLDDEADSGLTWDSIATGADPHGVITLSSATSVVEQVFRQRANLTGVIGTSVLTIGTSSFEACNALTSISFPVLTTIGTAAFRNCTHLTSVNLPELTTINQYTFGGCTQLNNVTLPKLGIINNNSFEGCTGLTNASFPMATQINNSGLRNCRFSTIVFPRLLKIDTYGLSNNANLTAVDFNALTQFTGGSGFINDTSLTAVVIRTGTMATLSAINHFNNTPFASNGTGGTLYVPSSLISQYEQATNWSTILGYPNNQILAIEGSYYETHYADGTVIS